jgi:acetolactate synthase-1/3 small subunit
MREILSVLVDNHAGVLARVSGLFSRRAYNIVSLAVGVTDNPAISRMTIIVNCDERTLDQVVNQIAKLTCVHTVHVLTRDSAVSRELALVKVQAAAEQRAELLSLANVFRARIIDVGRQTMTLEMTGEQDKIEAFMDLMGEYGILEMARTGMVALERGEKTIYTAVQEQQGEA